MTLPLSESDVILLQDVANAYNSNVTEPVEIHFPVKENGNEIGQIPVPFEEDAVIASGKATTGK